MAEVQIGKALSNKIVVPYFTTGAFAFLVLCLLMLISAESFTGHYFNPHILTIVHIAALGWGTMVIFGAAYQLLPVICEHDFFSPFLASICWYTLLAGVGLLAFSFWDFTIGLVMITGGALVVMSSLLYFINVLFTSRIWKGYTIHKLYLLSSSFWLLFTTSVGLLLAINLYFPFFEKNHLDILKLHAHLGFAGWFLQLIVGVSCKLIPMFLLGKSNKEYLLKYGFILQNTGLILFLVDGYFLGLSNRVLIFALIIFIGVGLWIIYLYDVYRNRVRKKVDIMMRHTFVSILCLLMAMICIPIVWLSKGEQWVMMYGVIILMGWITGIILGKTFKTLPFIIWNGHYKNLSGKVKVPLPKDLYSEQLIKWQFWLFIAALVVLSVGISIAQLTVIRVGLVFWLIVSVLYVINVIKTLLHKTTTFQ